MIGQYIWIGLVIFCITILQVAGFQIYNVLENQYQKKKNKWILDKEQKYDEELNSKLIQLGKQYEEKEQKLKESTDEKEKLYIEKQKAIENSIQELEKRAEQEKNKCLSSIAAAKKEVDITMEQYEAAAENAASDTIKELEEQAHQQFSQILNRYENEILSSQTLLNEINEQIQSHKKIQDAINTEIRIKREKEEKQNFYKVCLDEKSLSDIALLNQIKEKLQCHEKIDKIIYDTYVAKPVLELVRRLTEGRKISGIYKITYIPTEECYIGKSVDIGNRWKNHIKSAFGLEGVADSVFQRALKKYGVENFTFEILEEVEQSKLSEREQFWIDYFNTTKYGFNQRSEKNGTK